MILFLSLSVPVLLSIVSLVALQQCCWKNLFALEMTLKKMYVETLRYSITQKIRYTRSLSPNYVNAAQRSWRGDTEKVYSTWKYYSTASCKHGHTIRVHIYTVISLVVFMKRELLCSP